MSIQAVQSISTVDAVAAHLKRLILGGDLAAGTELPSEQRLAAELGVSRPTLREATRMLEQWGLVKRGPNRRSGFVVSDLKNLTMTAPVGDLILHELIAPASVFEVLALIEPAIIRNAVERATDDELAEVRAAAANLNSASSPSDLNLKHTLFHDTIAAASGNQLLVIMHRTLDEATSPMLTAFLGEERVAAGIKDLHTRMAEAIASRDVDSSMAIADEHLRKFQRQYEVASRSASATRSGHDGV